jgi:hypothetical protein
MIQYFKTPPHRRRMSHIMWTVGASAIFFLLLFLLALTAIRSLTSSLPGADAADRWKAEDALYPYTQLTVYTDSTAAFDLNTIYLQRMNIEQDLKENAISVPEGASAYIDAFSGETVNRGVISLPMYAIQFTSSRSSKLMEIPLTGIVTFTLHDAVNLPSPAVAVMVALPAPTAFTTPLVTVATVLSLLDQVTSLFVALAGATVAVNVSEDPFACESEVLSRVTPVTGTSTTVTRTSA